MKISIITATYNSAATLEDTLRSVLMQTHEDYELIIQDGGSTDDTLNILRRYEERFAGRLRYESEPDRGIYDAMNKGIRRATGSIVGILNSDDYYTHSKVLEVINERFQQAPAVDVIHGDVHYVHSTDPDRCVRYYSSAFFSEWQMPFGVMPPHPSVYCKRNIYEAYGLYHTDFRLAADFEFLLQLFFREDIRRRYVPMDFVTMRTGGATTSGWKSYKLGMQEHRRALRLNKIHSAYPLLLIGLGVKFCNLMLGRLISWKICGQRDWKTMGEVYLPPSSEF